MPKLAAPSQARPGVETGATDVNPYGEIVRLARDAGSKREFIGKILRCITRAFKSPYAALHVRYGSEVIEDDYHIGPSDPKFWKTSLQAFLTDSLSEVRPWAKLLKSRSGDTKVAFLSAPVYEPSGETVGAIALVLGSTTDAALPAQLATLEALLRLASACTQLLGEGRAGAGQGGASTKSPSAAMAHAGAQTSAEELAFSITNELRNKLGCEQVALGLVVRQRVRVMSMSGLDTVNRRSPGVRSLEEAMEECLDADEPIIYQRSDMWTEEPATSQHRLHQQWHGAVHGGAVASIPLHVQDAPAAILSLRQRADQPFTREQIDRIRARVEPYAAALLLARRASRSLPVHVADACHGLGTSMLGSGHLGRKVVCALSAVSAVVFCFGSMPYHRTVPCVVSAAQIRHVAIPFDGILAAVHVVEGDSVQEGDVLARLDQRDLDRRIAELVAERRVLEREQDRAMAAGSPVEVQLSLAKQRLVEAKLAIVESRVVASVLRAPFDGVVVRGDPRKLVGGVLARGHPLFELAPLGQWRLELEIPESAAGEVAKDVAGVFVGYAAPEAPRAFRIARVKPAAQLREGRTVFVAEATIASDTGALRPGMEGVAKLSLGSRRIWWVTLHGVIDYLRMHLFL